MAALTAAQQTCFLCDAALDDGGYDLDADEEDFVAQNGFVKPPFEGARICSECQTAILERQRCGDPDLALAFEECGDQRLLPGFRPMPLPSWMSQRDVELNRLKMYKHIVEYARGKSLNVEIIDKAVRTTAEWQEWCCTYALKNPNKILLLKWDFTKPWCIARTNYELVVGNEDILACHWVAYHRDSFFRVCQAQSLDKCKKDIERFISKIHDSESERTEKCGVCFLPKLTERPCHTCHNSVCLACAKKIAASGNNTCPFCRADFLSPEARRLLDDAKCC